jgi:cytochrome P450
MPYGVGPRDCVGMRFAFMEFKIDLADILHKYNILPGENIEQGIIRQESITLVSQAVYVRIEKRSK